MNKRIYYRSPVVWNTVVFILFSIFFVFLQNIYVEISTIKNKELFFNFIGEHKLYLSFATVTILSIIGLYRFSKILFIAFIIYTFVLSCLILSMEFSKIILVILFLYLVIAYYFYQFLSMDLNESFYNPQFAKNDLFSPMLKKINCSIESSKTGKMSEGVLTNWCSEGCFIHLPEKHKFNSKVVIKVEYEGNTITQEGLITSKYFESRGYGVKFTSKAKGEKSGILCWKDFFEVLEELGMKPELLK